MIEGYFSRYNRLFMSPSFTHLSLPSSTLRVNNYLVLEKNNSPRLSLKYNVDI